MGRSCTTHGVWLLMQSNFSAPLIWNIPVPRKTTISCLNDYRPVALTPVVMKCFERILLKYINNAIPADLDNLHFVYRENCSMEDAVSLAFHIVLTHLQHSNTYVRMLSVEFSSAFNTVFSDVLALKLHNLGLLALLC